MASPPGVIQAAKETAPKTSKLKELTKKYGAAGVLVYLGVGMVDLGVIFGVIQVAGLDKVKSVERAVMETVYTTGAKWGITKNDPTEMMEENKQQAEQIVKAEDEKPSLLSVFLLAYGIHKTLLLPVRLTITAAITPAVVRKLHQIGVARYFPRLFGASVPK
jgi:uncharacterized membrane protein YhiD involved in acid resistance